MDHTRPSRTALSAAMYRAAHQLRAEGVFFVDPLALPIIGEEARERLAAWSAEPGRAGMGLFIAARSWFAERKLAEAVARGVEQVVVVGAGLDTLGLRRPYPIDYFEVDHPATQAWKRQMIAAAGLGMPEGLNFVGVNFETQSLGQRLAESGFDATRPAFFIWLGVVPYLSEEAIFATLGFAAGVPGAEIVFDYANPPQDYPAEARASHERRAANAASIGEPWISYFRTPDLHQRLRALGAVAIEDQGPRAWRRDANGSDSGGHLLLARWGAL